MINYYLLFFLYSPVILLCFLSKFKDRSEFDKTALKTLPFSLMISTVFITIFLSIILIQSIWYISPLFGYEYSDVRAIVLFFVFNIMILILVIIVLKIANTSIFDIMNIKKSFVYNMVIIGSVATLVFVLLPQILIPDITRDFKTDYLAGLKSMSPMIIVIFSFDSIILTPIVEETIFRGVLYPVLYRKIGRIASLLLTSYIFLHAHFGVFLQSISISLVIFSRGLLFVWLYDKKRTLVYPIGFHMLFNAWSVYLHII